MREISSALAEVMLSDTIEPVLVAKLIHGTDTVYFTTRTVTITDAGSTQIQGSISAATFSGQAIKPEKGLSSIGSMSVTVDDPGDVFLTFLNTLYLAEESVFNDKVEIYIGDARIDFADYMLWMPLYVQDFKPSEVNFTLALTDTQRITQKSLFSDPFTTELVGVYGYEDTSVVEVVETTDAVLVEHGTDWAVDPDTTVGYLTIPGVSKDGRDVEEVISYTGYTSTEFTGVRRARFGSERIDLSAIDEDSNAVTVELTEFVYIDLEHPTMVLALLTGDYGIVGATLPDSWHAGLDASLINTVSFENIGADLYQEHLEFRGLESENAKDFIAQQTLAPYGVFLRIDQNGQYELARYDYVSQQSAPVATLTYASLKNLTSASRDVKALKNYFNIQWSWRIDGEYYARNNIYLDGDSQTKYKFKSQLQTIELRGLYNRDKSSKITLDFVANSMLTRYANPSVTRTATALIQDVIQLEVGEIITVVADNEKDYRTLGVYQETFEVQGINFDFFAGTATLKLFASEGTPSSLIVSYGSTATSIDTSAYTDLAAETYGTVVAGVFQFTNGIDLPAGRYFFAGDVEWPDNCSITANGSVYIDCDNVQLGEDVLIDMKGRGSATGIGYFGTRSVGQSGVYSDFKSGAGIVGDRMTVNRQVNGSVIENGRSSVELSQVLRIENGQDISSIIPARLDGLRGAAGGQVTNRADGTEYYSPGGTEVSGGGGIFFSCTGFQYASSAVIDVSGDDNSTGTFLSQEFGITFPVPASITLYLHSGASSFGWPGVCIVALKDRTAVKPFLYDLVVAKTGVFSQTPLNSSEAVLLSVTDKVKPYYSSDRDIYASLSDTLSSKADTDFASGSNQGAIKVVTLAVAGDTVVDPGVDTVEAAPAPVFSVTKYSNTPRTALGDQVTYELTADADPDTKYVLFEYRYVPGGEWNPTEYVLRTESVLQITATGDTIEVRATGYNAASKPGGVSSIQIELPLVTRDSTESDGGTTTPDTDITVPDIKRLELVNRISETDWDKWKSPDATIRWAKLSTTAGGDIVQVNGAVDLHLEGYKIRVLKSDGVTLLRETQPLADSTFTYTYDMNKRDTDGAPVRELIFQVQAVTTTGYVSPVASLAVSNPAPAAPSGVVITQGFTSLVATFNLPTDVDFVGVDAYLIEGSGDPFTTGTAVRVTGNSKTFEGLTAGTLYTIGLQSLDQFGVGGQTAAVEVSTRLIESSALGDITTPVVIDASGGRLITNNSGYIAFHGAVDAPTESVNPLIFGTFDGTDYPFWVDSSGSGKYGALLLSADGSISSDNFSIDGTTGDLALSGNLSGSSLITSSDDDRIEINVSASNTIEFYRAGVLTFTFNSEAADLSQPLAIASWRNSTLLTDYANKSKSGTPHAKSGTGTYLIYFLGQGVVPNLINQYDFDIEAHSTAGTILSAYVSSVTYSLLTQLNTATVLVKNSSGTLVDPTYLRVCVFNSGV